jgi:hypothetical protein
LPSNCSSDSTKPVTRLIIYLFKLQGSSLQLPLLMLNFEF